MYKKGYTTDYNKFNIFLKDLQFESELYRLIRKQAHHWWDEYSSAPVNYAARSARHERYLTCKDQLDNIYEAMLLAAINCRKYK